MATSPKMLCFVAMPFGEKAADNSGDCINFDEIFSAIELGVKQAGLECLRADFDPRGGFIHSSMYEALMLAEFVVADLSLANPNVTYEVGVRHGARRDNTLLICSEQSAASLPFDFSPLRCMTYPLDTQYNLSSSAANKLSSAICERLKKMLEGNLPSDNPILQLTGLSTGAGHEKTDLFLERLKYSEGLISEVNAALLKSKEKEAIAQLVEIQQTVLSDPNIVSQLHSVLIAIFLGYREKKAYQEMLHLREQLPPELINATVVLEQLALAQNRLAERSDDLEQAEELRNQALSILEHIRLEHVSSETYGIKGRIFKGQYDSIKDDSKMRIQAKATLKQAIEAYEQGFQMDMRDYYPGVNAITCRLISGTENDLEKIKHLVPVVRFALKCASAFDDSNERYWQIATAFELACVDRDWSDAEEKLTDLLGVKVEDWMRETTAKQLKLIAHVFKESPSSVKQLNEFSDILLGK